MRIPLYHNSATPLYRQIENYLREGIATGKLGPESRLPASRDLARGLGVSRVTVDNAYAELEAAGLVYSRVGSGTFVLPQLTAYSRMKPAWPLWQRELAQFESMSKELQQASDSVIDFSGGGGDPRLFPGDDFRRTLVNTIRDSGPMALDYGDPRGYVELREAIARVLSSRGLMVDESTILVTSGAQQGIALTLQALLRHGDVILAESPTYGRALDLFAAMGLKVIGVPVDGDGMQVELLEPLLQQWHPRLIYTIPNFQNPTGTCMSACRRRRLLVLADRYNIPLLEDDFVGDLRYEGSSHPSLKSLDPGGRVIYVSSFSKMLLPGIRIGFLVADGPVYGALARRKSAQDLATSNVIQHALAGYVTVGRYARHLRKSQKAYELRRNVLLTSLRQQLPSLATETPFGGLFAWARLPEGLSANTLLPIAQREGVLFAPGTSFFTDQVEGEQHVRLNFAALEPAEIREGVARLSISITKALEHH